LVICKLSTILSFLREPVTNIIAEIMVKTPKYNGIKYCQTAMVTGVAVRVGTIKAIIKAAIIVANNIIISKYINSTCLMFLSEKPNE
jgi:hypothetical protein